MRELCHKKILENTRSKVSLLGLNTLLKVELIYYVRRN